MGAQIIIPADLKPLDGRFGCGPSKIRPQALAALSSADFILGTTADRRLFGILPRWD